MAVQRFFPGFIAVVPCKNPAGKHPPEPDPYSTPIPTDLTQLPLAIPEEIGADQNPLPRDNRPIMLACLACNSVSEYTADDVRSYPISTSAPKQDTDQDPMAVCFQFSCAASNCKAPLKVYVIYRKLQRNNPKLRDELAKRLRDAAFYATYPSGHDIHFPRSNDFEMTWDIACWPAY